MKLFQSSLLLSITTSLAISTIGCGDLTEVEGVVPSSILSELSRQDRCFLDANLQLNEGCLPARTEADWKVFVRSNDTSRVRNKKGWIRCLRNKECNPLKGIHRDLVKQFTESLIFRNRALAGANYSMIVEELHYQQFLKLWDTFGMGGPVLADHVNYACVGVGDCEKNSTHICTSNC